MTHDEIDLKNAGAIGFAQALLEDTGAGEMSPGPCADVQSWMRAMRSTIALVIPGLQISGNRIEAEKLQRALDYIKDK